MHVSELCQGFFLFSLFFLSYFDKETTSPLGTVVATSVWLIEEQNVIWGTFLAFSAKFLRFHLTTSKGWDILIAGTRGLARE